MSTKLKLDLDHIDDPVIRKNFDTLVRYMDTNQILEGFKFIEFSTDTAETNKKVIHGLGYSPKDIVKLQKTGAGTVTFNHAEFDTQTLDITTTGVARVRCLVGTFKDDSSKLEDTGTETI